MSELTVYTACDSWTSECSDIKNYTLSVLHETAVCKWCTLCMLLQSTGNYYSVDVGGARWSAPCVKHVPHQFTDVRNSCRSFQNSAVFPNSNVDMTCCCDGVMSEICKFSIQKCTVGHANQCFAEYNTTHRWRQLFLISCGWQVVCALLHDGLVLNAIGTLADDRAGERTCLRALSALDSIGASECFCTDAEIQR